MKAPSEAALTPECKRNLAKGKRNTPPAVWHFVGILWITLVHHCK
ncbi:MAG: hypothetical protein AAEF72_00685 [Gammaproteobacteria bacterium]